MTTSPQPVSITPLKCVPLVDEWSETLLGRLARRMGIRRPWRYDLDLLRPLLPARMQALDCGEIRYGLDPLPRWAVMSQGAQIYYCPACLVESRHIRSRWRLAQLTACTVHGLNLKPGLTEPAITSAYKSPGKRSISEITFEEAWESSSCPTPRAKDHLARIWASFEKRVVAGDPDAQIAEALAWALLSERLVDAGARSIRGPDYPPDGVPAHEHRAFWLERHHISIQPDEAGLSRFLKSLPLPAHRRSVVQALSRLIQDEHRRKTIMSRLPLEKLKNVILAAEIASPARACGALPRSLHPPGHASFESAEARIGCEPGLLTHLIRNSLIKGVQRTRHGRKTYIFIPEVEVRRLRKFFANCWSFNQMLETLAMDRRSYHSLRAAGLLEALVIGRWRRYTKASTSALLLSLEAVSRPVSVPAGLHPFAGDWLRAGNRPKDDAAALLIEVLRGDVPVYRDLSGRGLGAFYVDHQALARLRQLSNCRRAVVARRGRNIGQMALWSDA